MGEFKKVFLRGMLASFLLGGALPAEANGREGFIPYYAAEAQNNTIRTIELVLRVAADKSEVTRMTVEGYASNSLYVHRTRVRCTEKLEVSINGGRNYQPFRGNLCLRNEADEPQILYVDANGRVMLLHVDVD